ncbi:citrate-binding protein-like [Prosopis cineraria]|uniref:citrate-binding protein-like n=1 Tax=Prosopis cineraria TaxID=364024 RepID=UPI00240F6FC5|nr:citrate-binding protein-like [Prosopis cineraria]
MFIHPFLRVYIRVTSRLKNQYLQGEAMEQLWKLHVIIVLKLMMIFQVSVRSEAVDPTQGFTRVGLDESNFQVQRPYDVPVNQRYSFVNGVHRLWVYSTDKPHTPDSDTLPRTEIRITGHDYTSGVWQFEGYGYVPSGTTGVCIMQVFGGSPSATTLQLRVYDASLTYYRSPVLFPNMYDTWFRLNVIHDVASSNVKVYIDGVLKYDGPGRGQATHYFKFGVYTQNDPSHYMESRWKDIKLFTK